MFASPVLQVVRSLSRNVNGGGLFQCVACCFVGIFFFFSFFFFFIFYIYLQKSHIIDKLKHKHIHLANK